jgi:hypothetical protein
VHTQRLKTKTKMWKRPRKSQVRSLEIAPHPQKRKSTRPRSRRCRQRFREKQQQQSITTTFQKEISQEKEQWAAGIKQQQHSIHSTVLEAYGFVGDIEKSRRHNACNHLATMPHWYYFNRPTHLSFHDFTTTIKPCQNLRRLLGLGHKFIPIPRWT